MWHRRKSRHSPPAADEPPLSYQQQQEVFEEQREQANNQTHSENNPDVLLKDISLMPGENDKESFLKNIIIPYYGPYDSLNGKRFSFKYDTNTGLVYLMSKNTTSSYRYSILKIAMPKTSNSIPLIPHNEMIDLDNYNLYQFNCTLFYLQCRVVALQIGRLGFIKSEEEEEEQDPQDHQLMQCFVDMEKYAEIIVSDNKANKLVYSRLSQVIKNPLNIRHIYNPTHDLNQEVL